MLRAPSAVVVRPAFVVAVFLAANIASHEPATARAQRPATGNAGPVAATAPAVADLPRPVHYDELRALRTFFERVDVGGVAPTTRRPAGDGAEDIDALVASLPGEWEAPFYFVQAAVAYVPYVGSVRGARGALQSAGGNAIDQALLLSALLSRRGVTTRLVRGRLGWDDAVRLVGGIEVEGAPGAGDAWPRWVEGAADHWWVQAEREGDWIDLDPSVPGLAPGEAMVAPEQSYEQLPDELVTRVIVELLRRDEAIARTELGVDRIVGRAVRLDFRADSLDGVVLWDRAEATVRLAVSEGRRIARALGLTARSPRYRSRPSPFGRIFLDADAGPWTARLQVPGEVMDAGPFERSDLDSLAVRVSIAAPRAPAHVLEVPWSGGTQGALVVLVAAGRVSEARLAAVARPLYDELNRLAAREQAARASMLPPIAYAEAVATLQDAATEGWRVFEGSVPEALGWALLHGIGHGTEASPAARVVRQRLRLAAVRWRPPDDALPGALEVVVSDPVTVGQLRGGVPAAALRAASGLLQSAALSQILNRIMERPPETAFDVTLRAIGSGRNLAVFRAEEALPADWPAVMRAEATVGLRNGFALMAPRSFADGLPGGWNLGVVDGEMTGWIPAGRAVLQGIVDVGPTASLDSLDALLASLPSLHRALRWLADLGGSGPGALGSVPSAACASAAVAADLLGSTLAAPLPAPDVIALCGAG